MDFLYDHIHEKASCEIVRKWIVHLMRVRLAVRRFFTSFVARRSSLIVTTSFISSQ